MHSGTLQAFPPSPSNSDKGGKKLNVLLLNSIKILGGGEIWMVRLGELLQANGHKALLVARPKSPLFDFAEKSEIPKVSLSLSGDLNPILLWRLARLIKEHSINIVVANMSRDVRIAGMIAPFCKDIRVVALQQVDRPIKNIWNHRLTFNFFADAIVVNSQATRQTLRDHSPWLDQKKVNVIPHGIDTAKYRTGDAASVRLAMGLPAGAFVAGFVGRLCEQKGIAVLLSAIEQIHKLFPEIHFVIVGEGTMELSIREFVDQRGLGKSVHVFGFRDDIPSVMQAFDVLLVPSIWEGFGLVLIEAMAAGVPCIASRISSIPEIVQHRVNGLLITPRDAGSLVDGIRELYVDPALRRALAAAAQQTVEERFGTDGVLKAYEQLFLLTQDIS